jgi:pyridoxal phosphate enzyme (YggS family)
LEERIHAACHSAGRDRSEVTLIAVSKTHPIDKIIQVYDLGVQHFGESRWQEAAEKLPGMPPGATLHFIGRLQSNKVKKVGNNFHVLHTIESKNQVHELAKIDHKVDVFIEVNIAREEQKSGVFPEGLDEITEIVLQCSQANLRGLMTIGPVDCEPEQTRNYFRQLRELSSRLPGDRWLSMGMSADFELAIQEGATHVRVGSAIFGDRP